MSPRAFVRPIAAAVALSACAGGASAIDPASKGSTASGASGASTSGAGEAPDVAPLTDADLGKTWVKLPVPQANMTPSIAAGPKGWLVVAGEYAGSGKASLPSTPYLYQSDDGVTWRKASLPPPPAQFLPDFYDRLRRRALRPRRRTRPDDTLRALVVDRPPDLDAARHPARWRRRR